MSEAYTLRIAAPGESEILTDIRTRYVRDLYRGYADASILKQLDTKAMQEKILSHMQRPRWQVAVLELGGIPQGYISFGCEEGSEDGAIIDEAAILPSSDAKVRYELISYAIATLEKKGYRHIHLWVLRDNFRVRFLYESFGFRKEGVSRSAVYAGRDVEEVRYLYVPNGGLSPY